MPSSFLSHFPSCQTVVPGHVLHRGCSAWDTFQVGVMGCIHGVMVIPGLVKPLLAERVWGLHAPQLRAVSPDIVHKVLLVHTGSAAWGRIKRKRVRLCLEKTSVGSPERAGAGHHFCTNRRSREQLYACLPYFILDLKLPS